MSVSNPPNHTPDQMAEQASFWIKLGYHENALELAGSNKPFLLNDPKKVWVVHSGKVDVFAVHLENGEAAGARRHLFRAEAGQAIFGMDLRRIRREMGLLAVGVSGTRLLTVERTRLEELSRQPDTVKLVTELVSDWVNGLSQGLTPGQLIPRDFTELQVGQATEMTEDTVARPRKGSLWVNIRRGIGWFMGRKELPLMSMDEHEYLPVSEYTWVTAVGKNATFYALDTETFFRQEPSAWESLANFHRLAINILAQTVERERRIEFDRLKTRADYDRTFVRNTFAYLVSVLKPQVYTPYLADFGLTDPLLIACRLVGDAMDLRIRARPDPIDGQPQPQTLDDIAGASHIRMREVALRGEWWRTDSGPLLGFIQQGTIKKPAAIIPDKSGQYILHDPQTLTRQVVTAETVELLAPFAYTFYRPFPDREMRTWDVLRFGLRDSRRDLLMVLLMGIAGGLLGIVPPLAIGAIIDSVIPNADTVALVLLAVVLLASAVAAALFQVTRSIAVLRLESRLDANVQAAVWDRLLKLPVPFFRDFTAGDLSSRALGISDIRRAISGTVVLSMLSGIFSIFNFVLLFFIDARLAILATFLVLIAVAATSVTGLWQTRSQRELTNLQGKISGMVLEFVTGISKLRVAGVEGRVFAYWAREFAAQRILAFKARRTANSLTVFNAAYPVLASMALFALMAFTPEAARISTGSFVTFYAAFGQFLFAGLQLSAAFISILRMVPVYERATPILHTLPEVSVSKADPGALTGVIEISRVSFRYKEKESQVLRGVSLQIQRGEFVALVGPSGSGKSTLLRLLLGFETPESGAIFYDGQNLNSLDLRAVRRQLGVVLQNSQLMTGDIYTNIAGQSRLSVEEAWEAARLAGLDEDIRQMPMGMQTYVSAGSSTLSGGQRQRILIARAIAHRPRILLFDEATSALDNQTQQVVSQSLSRLDATRIVIAHRLTTIVNADRIVVFDKGQIAQEGTYTDLLKPRTGLFYELARRQLS